MRIWAISDLHLSFAKPKPMDVFGEAWKDHVQRIETAWRERVAPDDVVCLPGDLSWAMRLHEALGELRWLGSLPGRKVLVKGNHDYWWGSLSRLREALPEGAFALQNDALVLDGVGFGGTRGWVDPALDFGPLFGTCADAEARMHGIRGEAEDARIYRRELERLERSLRRLPTDARLRVALIHFPPTSPTLEETPVTRILERHRVNVAVFGHLHGTGAERAPVPFGERNGVRYFLVSADLVGFEPVPVAEVRGP